MAERDSGRGNYGLIYSLLEHAFTEEIDVERMEANFDTMHYFAAARGNVKHLALLLSERGIDAQDALRLVPRNTFNAYQYIALLNGMKVPPLGGREEEIQAVMEEMILNPATRETFGESLTRFASVSRPTRYLPLSFMPLLQGRPLRVMDIGGASGTGFPYQYTTFGQNEMAGIARLHRLSAPQPLMLDQVVVMDVQDQDDTWAEACSTIVGAPYYPNNHRLEQAFKYRNAHPDVFKREVGNIFTGEVKRRYKGQFDTVTTFFVLHNMIDTYPLEAWQKTVACYLQEGGIWLQMGAETKNPDGSYPMNVYMKQAGTLQFIDQACAFGDDQEMLATVNPGFMR